MQGAKDIIFIGDSLIEWFDWGERFGGHRVQNLGISGETVEMLLDRLPLVKKRHQQADLVFVQTGINNVAMEDTEILGTYAHVVKGLRESYPRARIYLTSLLPTLLPWINGKTIENLNRMLAELAGDAGVEYFDAHSVFQEHGVRKCLVEDGIHISPEGYEAWASAIELIVNS